MARFFDEMGTRSDGVVARFGGVAGVAGQTHSPCRSDRHIRIPVSAHPAIGDDFILCQHSRNTFSPLALGNRTAQFAAELRELLAGYANADGMLEFRVKTHLTFARLKD